MAKLATATPVANAVLYAALSRPIRSGKCRLIRLGISTLAAASPARASVVAARKTTAEPVRARMTWPVTIISRPSSIARCSPIAAARPAARTPNPAKHSTGRVVSSPASAPLRASESLITVSCGPMAMAVGRRLKANVSTATTISQRGQPGRVGSADSGTAVTLWRLARLAAVATRTQPEQHAPPVQRLRIKYAKRGRARFTSHRDFGRAFERALRRAAVPMAYSSGFSPHPRISYANAAPTGAASEAEYLEIGLAAACDPARSRPPSTPRCRRDWTSSRWWSRRPAHWRTS